MSQFENRRDQSRHTFTQRTKACHTPTVPAGGQFDNGDASRTGSSDQRTPRTSPAILFAASVLGALGALFFGVFGALIGGFSEVDVYAIAATEILFAITGVASGASFVGLCALASGSNLGQCFTYPFTVFFGSVAGLICFFFVSQRDVRQEQEWYWIGIGVWFAAIILGALGGVVLARYIRGYGSTSRAWGTKVLLRALLIGAFLSFLLTGGHIFGVPFLVSTLMFATFCGLLGAITGAIKGT